jgi:hypothetical protein
LHDDGVCGFADGRVVGQQGGCPHLALDPEVEGGDVRLNGRLELALKAILDGALDRSLAPPPDTKDHRRGNGRGNEQ